MKIFRDFGLKAGELVLENCKILNVEFPFTMKALRNAYWRRSKETHPDAGGSNEAFRKSQEAYEFLQPYCSEELSQKEIEDIEWKRRKVEEEFPFKNFVDCDRCNGKGKWVEEAPDFRYKEETIICQRCHGTGVYTNQCRVCNGTGKFKQHNGRIVDCIRCNGSGFYKVGNCFTCHGEGFLHIETLENHGRKKVYHVCHVCDGTGKIEIWNPVLKKGVVSK